MPYIAQPPFFINNILDFACSLLMPNIDCDTCVCVGGWGWGVCGGVMGCGGVGVMFVCVSLILHTWHRMIAEGNPMGTKISRK